MERNDIIAAAGKLTDVERLNQMMAAVKKGAAMIISCGDVNLTIAENQGHSVRPNVEVYIEGLIAKLEAEITALGAPAEQGDFDAQIAKLAAEAAPRSVQ
jgi:hypothetical protein